MAAYRLEYQYNGTWVDISPSLHAPTPLIVDRGLPQGGDVAQIGEMRLALYDPDGRYHPDMPGALDGFTLGAPLRLSMHDKPDWLPIFTGRITEVTPQGEVTAITAQDDIAALARLQVGPLPLVIDVNPADVIAYLVGSALTPLEGPAYEPGTTDFPWAGDTWPERTRVLRAIEEVCHSEAGRFFMLASGAPRFEGRRTRPANPEPVAVLGGGFAGLVGVRSLRRMATRVELTVTPREVGFFAEPLWQAAGSIVLLPGTTRTLTARYRDPGAPDVEVGAFEVYPPAPTTDYTANTAADGAGMDITSAITVIAEMGVRATRLTLTNNSDATAYIRDLQVRGMPLRAMAPVTVVAEDAFTRDLYGLHILRRDMPLQESTRVADDVAQGLLLLRKGLQVWVSVTLDATASDSARRQAARREVGERITVDDPSRGLYAVDCYIDHIRHEIRGGGRSHLVMWHTSPAEPVPFFIVGRSTLEAATILGY